MKNKLLFIACLLCGTVNAQTKIQIKDFSKKYYAQVVTKPDSSSYYIEVYEKGTNKRLIEAEAEQISDDLLENDQLVPNVKELPYGNQSVLIYEDFNFDGIKDFAIMNGFQSCYGGPSFDIYLGNANTFARSESFSELSNNYCGMFQVDTQRKRILTMTKSGCCWHQYSEYIVKDNAPVAVKVVEESAMGNNAPYFVEINTKEWIDGKQKEKTKLYMPYENVDTLFAFKLKKNKKTVCVFSQDSVLYYALIRADASIEFSYPDTFFYAPAKKTLGFRNKDVYYELYETGVRVKLADGTLVDLEGDTATIKGALSNPKIKKNGNIKQL
jgi:hypothetical protein